MMKSRCRYIGLCNLRNNLQHLILYSTKSITQSTKSPNLPFTKYLINNLGTKNPNYFKLRTKNPNYFKSSDNANSVVDFLKQHGFDDTHLIKVISSYPKILASNVDKTLKPKFKLLQDQGFSESNLVSFISSSPSFVGRNIHHIFHDLRAILGSNENLIKFFRKTHLSIGPTALGNLNSNMALLNNEYGLDINVIRHSILQHPIPYLRNTQFFGNVLVRVEEELGIPRNSGRFLCGMYLLCMSSKKTIESKCQLLKSFGWTEYHISELMRRNPMSFQISEENMRRKLGYLMTELGYKPNFLTTRSVLLGCSLEKRMVPRHRVLLVLKGKGLLDYNFYSAILKSEQQFLKIFIEPFKEDVLGLLELYQSNKSGSNIDAISG